jgi:hypothetical protein
VVQEQTLAQRKERMIQEARRRYRSIRPCSHRKELGECFTVDHRRLFFWFNTSDESTHVMTRAI